MRNLRDTPSRLTTLFWSLLHILDAWSILLLIVLGLWISNAGANDFGNAQKRDCAEIARSFLAQHHMRLETAPRVFLTVPIKLAGWFDSGIVFIRNDRQEDCGVFVHEFVHAHQYQVRGPARTQEEWYEREREAVRMEMMWRGE
jgi:hypothetical protein